MSSSEDDVPLSSYKKPNVIEFKEKNCDDESQLCIKRKASKKKKVKGIASKRKKNDTKTKNLDSVSDTDKFQYFDKNRSRKIITLRNDYSIEDLQNEIDQIKAENFCLKVECKRICNIKIIERLKLHEEIKRLKNIFTRLKISSYMTRKVVQATGTTINFIKSLKENLESLDYLSMSSNADLAEQFNSIDFTNLQFWEDFNSTERNSESINSEPFWVGDLDDINPDSNKYYTPNESLKKKMINIVKQEKLKNTQKQDCSEKETNFQSTDCNDDCDNPKNKKTQQFENSKTNLEYYETDSQTDDIHSDNLSENQEDNEADLCTECGHGSSWTSFVARHREAFQNGVKLPPCDTCNQKFLKSGHFSGQHRLKKSTARKNRPQNVMCEACGARFATLSGLSQHRLKHEKARFFCAHCSHRCHRKAAMIVHIRTHFPSASKRDNVETDRIYGCESCYRTFKTERALDRHRSSHRPKRSKACQEWSFSSDKLESNRPNVPNEEKGH